MKRMHSSGNDGSCISFSSLRRDPFVKHGRRLEGKKKKREQAHSTHFPTISTAFKKRKGSRFLSWFIYILCIASLWRIALLCIMAGRTSIVVYLLARRNTLGTSMQPTESWYEVESRSIFSEDSLRRYSDTEELYLAHVILVIPRERERYIFLGTVIFPLSRYLSLRAFCLVIADSVFHNNRDGKRANVPCREVRKNRDCTVNVVGGRAEYTRTCVAGYSLKTISYTILSIPPPRMRVLYSIS